MHAFLRLFPALISGSLSASQDVQPLTRSYDIPHDTLQLPSLHDDQSLAISGFWSVHDAVSAQFWLSQRYLLLYLPDVTFSFSPMSGYEAWPAVPYFGFLTNRRCPSQRLLVLGHKVTCMESQFEPLHK
jgi:hypothetical protein